MAYPLCAQLATLLPVVDGILDLLPNFEPLGLADDIAEVEEDLFVVAQCFEESEAVLDGRDIAVDFFVGVGVGVAFAVG